MNWPTSQDYNEAVQDPATSFSDPALKGGEVAVNAMGLPVPRSGNFADVYQFTGADGKVWALKCFTRKVPGLRERYAKIDSHLAKAKLPFTVGFQFLQQGIQIRGEWYPLLKMEWVEGFTLNDFVARNLGKPHHIHALMQMWAKLAGRLRDANMAHADLQHGNVLLVPGATPQKLGLKLIDYDGMWVPALAEHHSGEVGHPNFQHPLRLKEKLYNGDVDRFPHLVIGAGLRATLIGGKPIWERFDNEDNLLFKESDLRDPAKAPVFKALWELNDPVLRTLVGHIALSASQPLRKTPWLDDVLLEAGGPRLTSEQEKQVGELLGVSTTTRAAGVAPSAAVEQEFNVFQFFDDDDTTAPAAEKARPARRSASLRTPPNKKSKLPLLIGGGVLAACVLIGAVVVFAMAGKKGPIASSPQGDIDNVPKVADRGEDPLPKRPIEPGIKPKNDGGPIAVPVVAIEQEIKELKNALAGTRWDWGDGHLELRPDGSAYHPTWNEQFRLTQRWEALDRRTALLVVESGRKQNVYSVLEFSEDLGLFTGINFIGLERMPAKKRVGPLPGVAAGNPPTETKQELQRRLAGSVWEWENGRMTLKADGSVELPPKAGAGETVARWEAIDTRTALLVVEKGRANDRLAILQFSNDLDACTGYDFANAARLAVRKRLDARPGTSPRSAPVAVAALPTGRDYLFLRQGDPTLYRTEGGSSRKARELGRHTAPLRALAVAPDGSRAVTGAEDGLVLVWDLKSDTSGGMKRRIAGFADVPSTKDKWSFDVYEEGIVVRDKKTDKEETVPAGRPGFPVKGGFKWNLENIEKAADRLGQAVSDEAKLFDGALTVQVFEGGAQFFDPSIGKTSFAWHARRKPIADGAPATGSPKRADYVWLDDALPTGAKPWFKNLEVQWEFVGKKDGPVHTGEKAVKLAAAGLQQAVVDQADPGLRVGAGDVLFAYVYLDPKKPPEEIMIQWQTSEWHRAYWGPNKIEWGRDNSKERKPMGKLPESGKWVRLEVRIDDLGMEPGIVITGLALVQLGGTAYWDTIGVNTATAQVAGPAAPADRTLKVKLFGPQKLRDFNGDYEFTLYQEGILLRDNKSGTEATVFAGKASKVSIENPSSPFKSPVSDSTDVFDGALVVNLYQRGCQILEKASKRTWNHNLAPNQPGLGNDGPAGAGPGPAAPAPRELKSHTAAVLACAVSSDSRRTVSIDNDGVLCEWDLVAAKFVRSFKVGDARAVAFLADGKTVLVGTQSESAGVWDLETKTRTKNLPGHKAPVHAVCVSPRGDLAWTAEIDGEVRAWALPDFKYVGALANVRPSIPVMAISSDAEVLAVAGSDGTVNFFQPKTGGSFGTHPGKGPIHALAFLPGGQNLVAAREPDPVVIRLQPPTPPVTPSQPGGSNVLKLLQEADGGKTPPSRMGYRPDGKYLWLAHHNSITVADGATGRVVKTWPVEGNVWHAEFGPGTELYVTMPGGPFQAWDWEKGERLHDSDPAEQRGRRPFNFWAGPTPNRLLATTNSPDVLLWDTTKWKEVERFQPYPNEPVSLAAPYPGGGRFAAVVVGRGGPFLTVWDAVKRREAFRLDPVDEKSFLRLDVSPGGRWVVALSGDAAGGKVIVWDGSTGKHRHTISGVRTNNFGGGFSPGGDHYVYCEQLARRWDVNLADGKMTADSPGKTASLLVAAAPAAGLFATADLGGKICIWRFEIDSKPAETVKMPSPKSPTETPTPKGKEGHLADSPELSGTIANVAFSADGKKVFVATQKGIVHVLNAATAEETGKLNVSAKRLFDMTLLPKGLNPTSGVAIPERLYLLDEDKVIHVWDTEKGARMRDMNLAGFMPDIYPSSSQLLVAPGETHVIVLDENRPGGFCWDLRNKVTAVPPGLSRAPWGTKTRLMAYSADGNVAAAVAERKLLVYRARALRDIKSIDLTLTPNWLGLGAGEGSVAVADRTHLAAWNYNTGKELMDVANPHGRFGDFKAAMIPTGTGVVSGGFDRWLRVWDLRTGTEATKWRMENSLKGLTVSPDGKTAAVWHDDGNRVSVWGLPDLKAKKE